MSSVLGIVGHRSRVRALYKAILRLHKGMPPELKELGDKYVKEEFKRHKDAEAPFVVVFMKEWAVGRSRFFHPHIFSLIVRLLHNLKHKGRR